jgi:SanA protein
VNIKKVLKWGVLLGVLGLTFVWWSNERVEDFAVDKIYDSVEEIPFNRVGLLLGTSKYIPDGRLNLFYLYRLDAALELFEAGKLEFLLISGDNSVEQYNEPQSMKDDLVERGVPEEKIYLDYAGFRTLDSVIRAKEIFGLKGFTVISQQFHNERAIFVAADMELDVVGFNAEDVNYFVSLRVRLREKVARAWMMMDLFIGTDPKFLGEEIVIK